jgi:hypothetical protein
MAADEIHPIEYEATQSDRCTGIKKSDADSQVLDKATGNIW